MEIVTVRDLIEALNTIKDKDQRVCMYPLTMICRFMIDT